MALAPDTTERIARALGDFRLGLGVALVADGIPALTFAAETLSAARLAAARALGEASVTLTERRAATLKARAYDGDLARVVLPADADAAWVRALADPAGDLATPMKGPLASLRGGPTAPHRAAVQLAKRARLLPAALVVTGPGLGTVAQEAGLTSLTVEEVAQYCAEVGAFHQVGSARLPMQAARAGRIHLFRPADASEDHVAVEIGAPDRAQPVLARLHSACFTGDILGSLKCDCGHQLNGALAQMGAEGAGVLLYLAQEGRGIGLANKMRAYSLQDQGFDTVEANHRLGFEDDERDFRIGAALLQQMGFGAVRLLTNNPAKVEMLARCGLEVVERVPLQVGRRPENEAYLDTKAKKSGHLL